jgi:DNA-binding CsgD family transcriptional regulator
MDLYVPNARLAELEAALQRDGGTEGSDRVSTLVALAWHLRQRDSARALALCDAAQARRDVSAGLRLRNALTRCEILALRSQLDDAQAQLLEARRLLAQPGVDPLAEGDALLAEAGVAKARGQRERELDAYARGAAFFASRDDRRRSAASQAWVVYENAFGAPKSIDAPEAATGESSSDPVCDALLGAARGLRLSRRDPARAAELFLQASELAQQMGMVRHAVVCTMNAGTALQGLGDFDHASTCYEAAISMAQKTGWPALIGAGQTRLGAFLQELGRLEESRSVLSGAVHSLAAVPGGINKANACAALAQTLLLMGRGIEAVGPMAEAIRMYRDAQSTDNLAMTLLGQARALSAAGQPRQALAALDEAQTLIDRHGFSALVVGICEALTEIHQRHPALPAPPGMTLPNAALHHAEATLREGQKIAGWKAPAALFIQLAELWAAAGDMTRAYEFARKALFVKEHEAAHKLEHPLAVLRLRTRAAAPDEQSLSSKLLTPKEREILQLLARSYSNKEIATALEMGDETVKWHLKKIYTKLEAGSRKHAVTRARTLGVITFSS